MVLSRNSGLGRLVVKAAPSTSGGAFFVVFFSLWVPFGEEAARAARTSKAQYSPELGSYITAATAITRG